MHFSVFGRLHQLVIIDSDRSGQPYKWSAKSCHLIRKEWTDATLKEKINACGLLFLNKLSKDPNLMKIFLWRGYIFPALDWNIIVIIRLLLLDQSAIFIIVLLLLFFLRNHPCLTVGNIGYYKKVYCSITFPKNVLIELLPEAYYGPNTPGY